MISLCAPALIYVIFSISQILIDTFKGLYNTALMKIMVMTMITFLLNILCEGGLGIISWIIVFIPFIFMTVIVTLLLYIFGLKATTGVINDKHNIYKCSDNVTIDSSGNIIIYDPYYDIKKNQIKYVSPNLYIKNPLLNN